ncbi:unnamed protein product [Caenorhabditis sp. 36 PRJEB53466]|nr:unnamed protein product [Caenorhabditis sp. 36 PRJEB53466]
MADRSRHRGIPPVLPLFLLHLFLFVVISIGQADANGCDRYVKCRSELLEVHWKCAEPSRRFTQHACKINSLYGNHKATSYDIESLFTDCTQKYSAISEIDYLLMTDPSCNTEIEAAVWPASFSSATCWSDLIRLTQRCFALSRCCPAAQRCASEVERELITEQFELEKSQMKMRLEECSVEMSAVLRAPVSREDAMIALKVSEATKVMLRSVVPFRVYPDPQRRPKTKRGKKAREFAALLSNRPKGIKRPIKSRYGISKQKYSTTVRAGRAETLHAPIEPPTTSLRPFTVLHHGGTVIQTTSQPPAFSPFTFQSIDFEARFNRKLRKGKKRRHRKKKHDFEDEPPFAQASKITESRFDAQHAVEKLDKLNGNLKQKGEYGRSILPKMLMVKQNKGKFLGYAQPMIKPLQPTFAGRKERKQTPDQIYDDLVESQISDNELTNEVGEAVNEKPPKLHFMPTTPVSGLENREAFINNNGAWTMEPSTEPTTELPPPPSTLPPPTITFPTTLLTTSSARPPSSRFTFAPFRRVSKTTTEEPTTSTEEITITPTTTTSAEVTATSSEAEPTTETRSTSSFSVDPLVDYVTHELLNKHMEKPKSDEDEFDFSSADYIDISAMDIEPSTSAAPPFPIPIARYEQANSSPSIWPMDGPHHPSHHTGHTTTPQLRTTAAPLSPGMLSEQQNSDLIPLPTDAQTFGSIDVTPSPSISTTPLDNQLWPLPIRKRHRLKAMGAKMMEKMKPIVILPMNKNNAEKMKEYKRRLATGCQRYDTCLRKEVEMRLRCADPYPTPYDKCSAQLLPLYRLIDEASNNKLQFFIKCVGSSQEQNTRCFAQKTISEKHVTCENLDSWSTYCRQLEQCCPAKDRCDSAAELDHVGSRLRLLEKSFSLRAAACQFKHAFHRTLARMI